METLERVKGKRCEQNVWRTFHFLFLPKKYILSQHFRSLKQHSTIEQTYFSGGKEWRKKGNERDRNVGEWMLPKTQAQIEKLSEEAGKREKKLSESERNGFDRMTILLVRIWSATQTFESKCSKWPRIVMTGTKLKNQKRFNWSREHFCESFPISKKHEIQTRHVVMRRVPVQSLNFRLYSNTIFQTLWHNKVIKCK